MSGKIQGLRGRISKLQRSQERIQADLDAKAARQQQDRRRPEASRAIASHA